MRLNVTAKTDVGVKRDHNEDFFVCDEELGLYIVCDGMGGHAAGEVASRLAAETIVGVVRANAAELAASGDRRHVLGEIMQKAVDTANTAVHDLGKSKTKHRGAGTTCTALLVRFDTAVMAHVGDSRLYVSRGGALSQISNDHTFVAEALRRGILSEAEAKNHQASHLLTRAVGPQARVQVDTLVFDLLPGDTLLLCSDGLHNYVRTSEELVAVLARPLADAAKALVDFANERGGEDNITVVLARTSEPLDAAEQLRTSHVNKGLEALQHIAIFSELTLAELMTVCEALTQELRAAGDTIVTEGDASESMYVVVAGSLEVRRAGKPLAFLDAGSHFGEMAMLTDAPRSATVRAATPCRLLVLKRDRLYDLVRRHPLVGAKVLWRLAQVQSMRLDDATMRLETEKVRTLRLELFPSPFSRRER